MKLDFDTERNIMEMLTSVPSNECCIISDCEGSDHYLEAGEILKTLICEQENSKWKDNSSSQFPPDFINEERNLILEVMRFDDHSPDGKKNPNLAKQRKILEEIESKWGSLPGLQHIHIIPDTGLPTEVDHNYKYYYRGFRRTVEKHLFKLPTYRLNHPNKKTVFLVVDESSGIYFEKAGEFNGVPSGRLHFIFCDDRFLSAFENSNLDYLILFCPNNYYETLGAHLVLPHVIIFDIAHMKGNGLLKHIHYDENRMVSSER